MVKKRWTSRIVVTLLLVFCLLGGSVMSASAKQVLPTPGEAAYAPEYASLAEAKRGGNTLNEEITAEGMILMKNEGGALPLKESERKVSVFGSISADSTMIDGGTGSGRGELFEAVTMHAALDKEGFKVNPKLKELYDVRSSASEIAVSAANYSADIESSYAQFSDVAFIVIGRPGHEGSDLNPKLAGGKHELEMTDNEIALFNYVKTRQKADASPMFKKIVVLLNLGTVFEVAPYVDDERVQAVLYVGFGGNTGIASLPKILTGKINPSGHTVDVWPAQFRQDPTWFNFGTNAQTSSTTMNTGTGPDGGPLSTAVRSLDYEEGVYMGYRWYETAATIDGYYPTDEAVQDKAHPTDPYYNRTNGIVFPFGYGLSYTSFEWTLGEVNLAGALTAADADKEIVIPVTVKNTGTVAGKDVVQAYVRAPYGETAPIEKGDVALVNFEKTNLLQPGESQTLRIKFLVKEFASFDWNDVNANGFQGYEIEQGTYSVLLRTDSHNDKSADLKVQYTVGEGGIKYSEDGLDNPLNYNKGFGESTAKAVFSQENEYNTARVGVVNAKGDRMNATEAGDATYISRKNWKLPAPPNADELALSNFSSEVAFSQVFYGSCNDKETDPWYKTEADIPGYGVKGSVEGGWKQAPMGSDLNRKTPIQLKDMTGLPLSDPKWVEFMNQLTWSEMTMSLVNSYYSTPALPSVGKPFTTDVDGPAQLRDGKNGGGSGTYWCSVTMIACTYNKALAERQGHQVGTEALLIGKNNYCVSGWYGPGLNTHRSPFGGRNFEYYSQDGLQAGLIGGAVVKGATEMGLHVYGKHYVVNDQDTDRKANGGISVWTNEQALREIYLKPFQYAIQYGNMNGFMNSHGRLGVYGTQNNFYLNDVIPRGEWGMEGVCVTDLVDGAPVGDGRTQFTNANMLIRSGSTYLGNLANQSRGEDMWTDGRILDGYYDVSTNRVMVPSSLTVSGWKLNNNGASNTQNVNYTAQVDFGSFTLSSPTQWYWVRTTAMNALFVAANSTQMQSVADSPLIGAYVSINYNDGVTPSEGFTIKKGDKIAAPKDPVVPEGKRFGGWFIDKGCTVPADFSKEITKYTALYALIADSNQYALTFDLNYADSPLGGKILFDKDAHPAPPPFTPYRLGYRFEGWYLEPECDTLAAFDGTMNTDTTLYAKWKPVNTYTVTFHMNYEGVFGEMRAFVNEGDLLTPQLFAPARNGYVFGGWFRDPYCNAGMNYEEGIAGDMTLYAKWTLAEVPPVTEDEGVNYETAFFTTLGVSLGVIVLGGGALAVLYFLKKKRQSK